jgi:hypothetical protein
MEINRSTTSAPSKVQVDYHITVKNVMRLLAGRRVYLHIRGALLILVKHNKDDKGIAFKLDTAISAPYPLILGA